LQFIIIIIIIIVINLMLSVHQHLLLSSKLHFSDNHNKMFYVYLTSPYRKATRPPDSPYLSWQEQDSSDCFKTLIQFYKTPPQVE